MITTLKIILILVLGAIFYQDLKERQVYWFLFLFLGICAALLFYSNTYQEVFILSIIINLIFVLFLIFGVVVYSRLKLKTNWNSTFGYGDVFFFLAIALSFSTISFIVIFVGALVFSLAAHMILSKDKTVPLAGYMSLFFAATYLGHWLGILNAIYQI